MTDRKGFLAAAAVAAGATGIIASQRPAEATFHGKVVILPASTPDEIADVEWHINHGGFYIQGFSIAYAGNTPYVLLIHP